MLSPFLYSVFIDDLPDALAKCQKVGAHRASTNILMHADDIALIFRSRLNMQRMLNICETHTRSNRYQFNVQKCATMSRTNTKFKLGSVDIPSSDTFTYLGVELNTSGIDINKFINRRIEATKKAASLVRNMGMNAGGFSIRTNSQLYKTFIRSRLESSLCILKPSSVITQKIESAQHLILAQSLGVGVSTSSTLVRSLTNVPRMSFRWKWLRTAYCRRLKKLPKQFLVVKAMTGVNSWTSRLAKTTFPINISKADLIRDEMAHVNTESEQATASHFSASRCPKGLP